MKKTFLLLLFICLASQTNAQPLTVSESHLNVSCFGYCNGVINVIPSGGTPPYSGSGTFTGICAGTYTITVTDGVGASASISVTVTEPAYLVVNVSTTYATCNGYCDGTAIASASGGTSPYIYSWCNGATTSFSTNLCSGSCSLIVTDNNGCESIDTVDILEPAPINYSIIVTNGISCFGACDGTICCAAITGGSPPYSYLWSPSGTASSCMFGVCAGSYTLCVTDVNGCIACSTAVVNEPLPIQVIENIVDASCFTCCDGSAQLTPSGGNPPYTFLWLSSGQTGDTLSNQCPGTYNYCVTDANGCSHCDSVTVSFPLGITNSGFDNNYNIFPNPANDFIDLETIGITNISVFDAMGKLILKEEMIQNKTRIDLSDFSNGIYFMQLQSADKIISKKFIKE